jgi:predicted small secreted protein
MNMKNRRQSTNETALLNNTLPEKMDPDEFNFTSYRTNLSSFPDYFLNLPEVSLETQWILQADNYQRIRPMKIVQGVSNRTILIANSYVFFDRETFRRNEIEAPDYYYEDILAIEMSTGDILWQYRLEEASATSILEHQGKIYFGTKMGVNELRTFHRVICLDLTTGKELWKQRIPGPVQTNFVILNSDQSLCFGIKDLDSFLFVLQLDTGEIVNKLPLSIHFDLYTNWSSLIPVQETTLCFSSMTTSESQTIIHEFDIITGVVEPVFHFTASSEDRFYWNMIQVGSLVCIVSETINTDQPHISIHAFDPESKTIVWTENIPTTFGFTIFTTMKRLQETLYSYFANKEELLAFSQKMNQWEQYGEICEDIAHRYNVNCNIQHVDTSQVIVSVSPMASDMWMTTPWDERFWLVIDAQSGEILGKLPMLLEYYESFEDCFIMGDYWEYKGSGPPFLALGGIQ